MVLKGVDRFYAPSGCIIPGGSSTRHLVDFDQRRMICVTMDEMQDSENTAVTHLLKHIDTLPADVYTVHFSLEGELLSTSNNPEDDYFSCSFRPQLDWTKFPSDIQTVSRTELKEVARVGPNLDLVVHTNSAVSSGLRQNSFLVARSMKTNAGFSN